MASTAVMIPIKARFLPSPAKMFNRSVRALKQLNTEEKIERAMAEFDYSGTGYCLDTTPGRLMYFYYDPKQYFKYIRPVSRTKG